MRTQPEAYGVVACDPSSPGRTWLRVTLGESTWTVEHDHGCPGPWSGFLAEIEAEITALLGVGSAAGRPAVHDAMRAPGLAPGASLLTSQPPAARRR